MYKVFIIVQNLRIGGFQRVALDEAYGFANLGLKPSLIVLEQFDNIKSNNFFVIEEHLIKSLGIKITGNFGSRINQFRFFKHIIRSEKEPIKFISHSFRGTVLIRFAAVFSKSNVDIFTTIHQLPSLSDFVQRWKRFFYSLFSDYLFFFSVAAQEDWESRVNSSYLASLILGRKKVSILRNGIYLKRLPEVNKVNYSKKNTEIRLVYLGRNTSWKGIETIIKLAAQPVLREAKMLFLTPTNDFDFLSNVPTNILDRITFQIGKSFESYKPELGDIHLYPANYGNGAKFIESISLNCLEMACVGVPSVVTKGGLSSWQDLVYSKIFIEVEWDKLEDTATKIANASTRIYSPLEIINIKKIIDIANHIEKLLKFF